jgi:hypothetical protein
MVAQSWVATVSCSRLEANGDGDGALRDNLHFR